MKHTDFRLSISALVDGEISAEERSRVEIHLAECSECREYEQFLRSVSIAIKEAADLQLSGQFTYDTLRIIRSAEENSRQWLPVEKIARRFVFALSLAVMLFVSISMIARQEEPVVMEPYLVGEQSDSSVTRTLLNKEDLSKDDVLFAAVTRK